MIIIEVASEISKMDDRERQRLAEKGWRTGSVAEFLELTPEEIAIVEIKLALSNKLEEWQNRKSTDITPSPEDVRVTENDEASDSLEQLVHSMLTIGVSPQEIGQLIASIG